MTTTASQHIDRDALLSRLTEHDVQAVYEALGVERFGPGGSGHWLVSRPWQATPETDPSVTICRIDGVWKDHARGEGGSIFDAVMRGQGCDFPAALQFVCEITGIGCSSNGHRKLQHSRRIVETYDYRAEDGRLLFQVVRTDPKDFRQRRPVGNGWEWNVHGVPLVLYRLPELLAAPKRRVFVCEGERDAGRLASLGFVATCNPQGVGKWKPQYSDMLRGRDVIILSDNDEPGYQHAHQVARSLYGIAAAVGIVELRGLGPRLPKHGKDTSDWIAAGGTQEELKWLVLAAPEWTPDDDEPADAPEADALERVIPSPPAWPDPPNEAVYYGLAGEIVRALEPATGADPVALLVTLLTAVGNIAGAEPHWAVSGTRHSLRTNPVFVGSTSKARKGTSWGTMRPLLSIAAPEWLAASRAGCRVARA